LAEDFGTFFIYGFTAAGMNVLNLLCTKGSWPTLVAVMRIITYFIQAPEVVKIGIG
jgi:hypothetical protein